MRTKVVALFRNDSVVKCVCLRNRNRLSVGEHCETMASKDQQFIKPEVK